MDPSQQLQPESEKKEVSLTLSSDAEAKALSRGTTRRRRSRKTTLEEGPVQVERYQQGGAQVVSETVPVAAPVIPTYAPASVPVPAAPIIPVAPPSAPAAQPAAVISATTAVGGALTATPAVKIQAKRSAVTAALPILAASTVAVGGAPAVAPKIVPHKKRLSTAPAAQTLKKPKFVVGGGEKPTAPPPQNSGDAPVPPGGRTETAENGQGGGGPLARKTRKFSERRISITVKPAAQTRRMRRTLKNRIGTMPIGAVRKYLLRKGVLKPKATAPPEEMMRSMMRDYLLLHAAE